VQRVASFPVARHPGAIAKVTSTRLFSGLGMASGAFKCGSMNCCFFIRDTGADEGHQSIRQHHCRRENLIGPCYLPVTD
jgi:hypothetical protein